MNDSDRELNLPRSLVAINLLVALGTSGFALAAVINPEALVPDAAADATAFYAFAYAARGVPLGIAVALGFTRRWRKALNPLLGLAGFVQLADIAIGAAWSNPGMIVGAVIGAVVPLGALLWRVRGSGRPLPA